MVAGRIDRQSDNLHVSALKLWFYPSHVAELGRADRGEVLRMREQDGPRIADPIVESYAASPILIILFPFRWLEKIKSKSKSQPSLSSAKACYIEYESRVITNTR